MNFKLKIVSSANGWMSVGLRKNNPIGNHNNSGVSVMIGPSGGMFFFDSETQSRVQMLLLKALKSVSGTM